MSRAVSPLVNLRSTFLDSGAKICSRSLCSCLLSICASAAITPSIEAFRVLTFIIRLNGVCLNNGDLPYSRCSALSAFGVHSQAFGDVKSLFFWLPGKRWPLLELSADNSRSFFWRGYALDPSLPPGKLKNPAIHFFEKDTQTTQLGLKRSRSFPAPRMIYGADRTAPMTLLTPSTLANDNGLGKWVTFVSFAKIQQRFPWVCSELSADNSKKFRSEPPSFCNIQLFGFAPAKARSSFQIIRSHYPRRIAFAGASG